MNNFLYKSGKISAIFTCVLLLAAAASAQISLRNALDYDGDKKADYAIFRPSNGMWYIKNSGGSFKYIQFGNAITDLPAPGDFDGDKIGDISIWRETTGTWYRINSSNNTFISIAFGQSKDEPVARDYDGDGKTDLAVVRKAGNALTWYVLGSMRGLFAAQFGAAIDYAAPGDYDGDGKFDFAVQRPGSDDFDPATFYILRSGSGTVQSVVFGFSKDFAVPGDYDGDGKTDIAVVREGTNSDANLNWYVRRSSDSGVVSYSFGVSTVDLTVQNDYDGDGKTDIAVWRGSNGTFYVLKSSDNTTTSVQWGSSGDYPIAAYDSH